MSTVRLLGGISLLWALSAHADIIQYQGLDGRRYFANTVPATSTVQPLPTLRQGTRLTRASARENQQARVMSLVYPLAQQYDIDADLVRAIIAVESNFDAWAVSVAGAQGLMQLMPETATRYQVRQAFDPRANIEGGIRYLKDLWQRFGGDVPRVLAAYNAGEGAVERFGGIPPYPETRRYVDRVLALYGVATPSSKIYRYQTVRGSILFTDIPR
ncbi:MAG: lytic transglycosylase domain-containing protein [Candidatus Tectomicrobia bacterium]|nr:lytic transglycosylase domain-containing protein [Candidatus Tectomicrobia bacterium]